MKMDEENEGRQFGWEGVTVFSSLTMDELQKLREVNAPNARLNDSLGLLVGVRRRWCVWGKPLRPRQQSATVHW